MKGKQSDNASAVPLPNFYIDDEDEGVESEVPTIVSHHIHSNVPLPTVVPITANTVCDTSKEVHTQDLIAAVSLSDGLKNCCEKFRRKHSGDFSCHVLATASPKPWKENEEPPVIIMSASCTDYFSDSDLCNKDTSEILFGQSPECSSDLDSTPSSTNESIVGFIEHEHKFVFRGLKENKA
ncbi:Cyclin-D1-1 [Senna tora]|uniref:Cyclin-D1-1 n=1 Tax=Senna tora TaxID=362788 RepID=A0A835CBW1_9FABA|nr:Cyclin-D1-1 [Senna tora]